MRTYPFTHIEQFRRSRTIAQPNFAPHNPNKQRCRRLFAAGLATAALFAFIYSVSLSVEPVFIHPDNRKSAKTPIDHRFATRGAADIR